MANTVNELSSAGAHFDTAPEVVGVFALRKLRPLLSGRPEQGKRTNRQRIAPLNAALVFAARKPPPVGPFDFGGSARMRPFSGQLIVRAKVLRRSNSTNAPGFIADTRRHRQHSCSTTIAASLATGTAGALRKRDKKMHDKIHETEISPTQGKRVNSPVADWPMMRPLA